MGINLLFSWVFNGTWVLSFFLEKIFENKLGSLTFFIFHFYLLFLLTFPFILVMYMIGMAVPPFISWTPSEILLTVHTNGDNEFSTNYCYILLMRCAPSQQGEWDLVLPLADCRALSVLFPSLANRFNKAEAEALLACPGYAEDPEKCPLFPLPSAACPSSGMWCGGGLRHSLPA